MKRCLIGPCQSDLIIGYHVQAILISFLFCLVVAWLQVGSRTIEIISVYYAAVLKHNVHNSHLSNLNELTLAPQSTAQHTPVKTIWLMVGKLNNLQTSQTFPNWENLETNKLLSTIRTNVKS